MNHYFLCCEPFFLGGGGGGGGKNSDIFMAAICDTALGKLADRRYFLGIVHI